MLNKGFACFEKSFKAIHSFAPSFNSRRAMFNALPKTHIGGPDLDFYMLQSTLVQDLSPKNVQNIRLYQDF